LIIIIIHIKRKKEKKRKGNFERDKYIYILGAETAVGSAVEWWEWNGQGKFLFT